jgi:penicillin amidase
VLADTAGNIAHVTTGRVPIRRHGDGSTPQAVRDGEDAWLGFIPAAEMPGSLNPSRGWVGNANHRTVPGNYPYAYSTDLAASWRYRRMRELLDGDGVLEPAQHWAFMRDVKNVMAAQVAPLMSQALRADADTQALAGILARWDHQDQPEAAAPLIFQAVFRHFAVRVYRDELGEDLATRLVDFWYYSQERLVRMLEDPSASWFDDIATPGRETRDDLFVLAAKDALAELVPQLGPDPTSWRWGDLHTLSFFSPLLPGDFGARLLGDGVHPKEGSGETLNRATYRLGQPYSTVSIAALRFVADLGDPDKVLAVVTGGASGRQFDRHLADQSPAWRSGEPRYWWFSDAAIAAHAQSELELTP